MNRRNAIISMAWATGGIFALSSCTQIPTLSYPNLPIKSAGKEELVLISQIILPEDPVHFSSLESREKFVLGWINDLFTKNQIEEFIEQFNDFQIRNPHFSKLKAQEQLQVIIESAKSSTPAAAFLKTLKSISIKHFTTTENYLSQYANYKFIPGRYMGCVKRN